MNSERFENKSPSYAFKALYDINEFESLQHHGILGQRWGYMNGPPYPLKNSQRTAKQRKLNPVSESIKNLMEKKEQKAEAKKAAKEAAEKDLAYKKSYKNMSDEEMRSLINRAQLEKQYKDLVLPKEKDNYAKKMAVDALKTVGNKTVNEIVIPLTIAKMKETALNIMESSGKYSQAQLNSIRRSMNMGEATGMTVKEIMNANYNNLSSAQIKNAKETMNDYNQLKEAVDKATGKSESISVQDLINGKYSDLSSAQMKVAKEAMNDYNQLKEAVDKANAKPKQTPTFDFTNIKDSDVWAMDYETAKAYADQLGNIERAFGTADRIAKKQYAPPNTQNGNQQQTQNP